MKKIFILIILFTAPLTYSSVRILETNGDSTLFFRHPETKAITYQRCNTYSPVGKNWKDDALLCGGIIALNYDPEKYSSYKPGRIARFFSNSEQFKTALSLQIVKIYESMPEAVKPLSPEDVYALKTMWHTQIQINNAQTELSKLNFYLEQNGESLVNLTRKQELENYLHTQSLRESAKQKLENEIQRIIDLISDPYIHTVIRGDIDCDLFIYNVLHAFDPTIKIACGLSGSIEERAADCKYQNFNLIDKLYTSPGSPIDISKAKFRLISRLNNGNQEILQELAHKTIWSYVIGKFDNQQQAEGACLSGFDKILKGFYLPSMEELKIAWLGHIFGATGPGTFWSMSMENSGEGYGFVGAYITGQGINNGSSFKGIFLDRENQKVICIKQPER